MQLNRILEFSVKKYAKGPKKVYVGQKSCFPGQYGRGRRLVYRGLLHTRFSLIGPQCFGILLTAAVRYLRRLQITKWFP
jgi:hypothetical protein